MGIYRFWMLRYVNMKRLVVRVLGMVLMAFLLTTGALALETVDLSALESTIAEVETEAPEESAAAEAFVQMAEVEQESEKLLASSGNCGEKTTWSLSDDGVLTIAGTGPMTNWTKSSGLVWKNHLTQIKRVVIESGVTSIGGFAFYGCTALTDVEIPNTVTQIGQSAFQGCTELTEIVLPDSIVRLGDGTWLSCIPGLHRADACGCLRGAEGAYGLYL